MAKVTRHNHPLMVNARRESYNAGRAEGFVEGRKYGKEEQMEACNETVERLHTFYRKIISGLEKKKNNQFKSIEISFNESQDMHFVSFINIRYEHSGNSYEGIVRYSPDHKFTAEEIVEGCNALLKQMILNHDREVEE